MKCYTKELVELMGWEFKAEKENEASSKFGALRVIFNLNTCPIQNGRIKIENKPSRIKQITETIDEVSKHWYMSSHGASELLGRIQFSTSQVYGKVGALASRELGKISPHPNGRGEVTTLTRKALAWLKHALVHGKPRSIPINYTRQPLYVFTDGSCEPTQGKKPSIEAGYGAVMYDPGDQAVEMAGKYMSKPLPDYLS